MNSRLVLGVAAFALGGAALAQSIDYRVTGANGQQLGLSADRVPDVDGDGAPELILAGRDTVRLVSGAGGATLFETVVATAGASARVRVAGLDDVDGDGAGDLAVAIVGLSATTAASRIDVRSGATGALLYSISGAHPQAKLGYELAALGDVNGDGRGDFAATSRDPSGLAQVAVYSGANGAQLSMPYLGGDEGDSFAVRSAGDIDGDGVTDLLVAAQTHGGYAFSGATGLFLRNFPMIPGNKSAQGIGDVNGDGRSDVVMLSLGQQTSGLLYSGATGELLQFLPVGVATASALGDVNGDGRADFGLGFGGLLSRFEIRTSSGFPVAFVTELYVTRFSLGVRSLVGLGDIDGDGRDEVAVVDGGYFAPIGAPSLAQGRAWVYGDVALSVAGTPFGFAAAGQCPCGNTGFPPLTGCANSTGIGAALTAYGTSSVAADDISFVAQNLPQTNSVLLGVGNLRPTVFTPVGDGLRALAGQVRRLRVMTTPNGGVSASGVDLASTGDWSAGETLQFQVFYRDPLGPCGSGINFTNAVEVTFTP